MSRARLHELRALKRRILRAEAGGTPDLASRRAFNAELRASRLALRAGGGKEHESKITVKNLEQILEGIPQMKIIPSTDGNGEVVKYFLEARLSHNSSDYDYDDFKLTLGTETEHEDYHSYQIFINEIRDCWVDIRFKHLFKLRSVINKPGEHQVQPTHTLILDGTYKSEGVVWYKINLEPQGQQISTRFSELRNLRHELMQLMKKKNQEHYKSFKSAALNIGLGYLHDRRKEEINKFLDVLNKHMADKDVYDIVKTYLIINEQKKTLSNEQLKERKEEIRAFLGQLNDLIRNSTNNDFRNDIRSKVIDTIVKHTCKISLGSDIVTLMYDDQSTSEEDPVVVPKDYKIKILASAGILRQIKEYELKGKRKINKSKLDHETAKHGKIIEYNQVRKEVDLKIGEIVAVRREKDTVYGKIIVDDDNNTLQVDIGDDEKLPLYRARKLYPSVEPKSVTLGSKIQNPDEKIMKFSNQELYFAYDVKNNEYRRLVQYEYRKKRRAAARRQ